MKEQSNRQDKIFAQIRKLQHEGDDHFQKGDFDSAIEAYEEGYSKLPGPKDEQDGAMILLVSIADVHFYQQDFAKACEKYLQALQAVNGLANPYINLRIGQASLELGNEEQAAEYLVRTFMMEGQQIFMDEDPKYWEFVQAQPNYDPSVI